jgi:Zn-dependent peptidase ImmA (M78 family)/transcriptional regulator with XRE-family HTH domain
MSAQTIEIPVKPAVLKWARESAGKTAEDVATRLSLTLDTVHRWESGEQAPCLMHLRELCGFLKRPLAAFFLPAAPQEPPPPGDFRRLPEDKAHPFSMKTILAIRRARMIQSAARDFVQDTGMHPTLPIGSATLADTPATLAHNLRQTIGITIKAQNAWAGNDGAFFAWKAALESRGLLIAELSFPLKEARGFSVMDTRAPLVVLNSTDSFTGKTFSLFHEYAHILLGRSGVLDNSPNVRLTDEGRLSEQFCNAFAADFLVPIQEFANAKVNREHRISAPWTDQEIDQLAQHFHVSAHVIVRRLLTLGKMSEAAYSRKSDEYDKKYQEWTEQKRFGKRVPAKVCLRENGRPFVALVYDAFDNQRITYKDIADYLGTKPKYVDSVARLLKNTVAA